MKNLKKLMIGCVLLAGLEQVTFTKYENKDHQNNQHHGGNDSGHQGHGGNDSGHQGHGGNDSHHQGHGRGDNQSQHGSGHSKKTVHIGPKVIKKLLDAVKAIPAENKQSKKPKTGKYQTKESRDNTKSIVEKAKNAYMELYDQAKKPNTSVTESEAQQIKKAAKGLFNAVNIQNAVLPDLQTRPNEGGKGGHQSGQGHQSGSRQ